jgi:hypothetical protein
MNKVRSKGLALMLAAVMLMGTVGTGFSISYTSSLFGALLTDYVTKFKVDKLGNASKLYVALDFLNNNESSIEGAVSDALDAATPAEMIHLQAFGLDDVNAVMAIYEALKNEFPANLTDFTTGTSLFARIYKEANPNYEDYSADFEAMLERILAEFPAEFQDALNKIAPTTQEKAKLLDVVNDAFRNGGTQSYLGTWTKSTELSNNVVTYTLNFDTVLIQSTLIKTAVNTAFSEDISDSFVAAYVAATSIVLEAMEDLLEDNTAARTNTAELLKALDLIQYKEVTTGTAPDGGDTGGSSGGGGGGGTAPAPGPAPAPPVEEPIPTPEKPVGTPNPDATYTSTAMRDAFLLLNDAVVTQSQVDPILEDLEEEVLSGSQDIVETLQIVERAVELAEKILDNDSLTDQGVVNYVNQILTQFVAPALEKDINSGTHHELEALAAEVVELALERIGSIPATDVITEAMVKAALSEQNTALVFMEEGLSAVFTDAQIAALSQNVSTEIEGTTLKLDSEAVAYMKSSDLGIKIESGSVAMTIPNAMLDAVRAGFSLVTELAPKSVTGLDNKIKNGGAATIGSAYDLSVYLVDAEDAVVEVLSNVQPLVSLPLGSLKLNLHTVGAYYYNKASDTWEYVRSRVIGDRVVFRAPHLSTYGVLQRSVVFTDMTSHWAKSVIEGLAVKGIVSGRSLTEYEPNGTITRAEFATILVQALQLKGDIKVTFNDVYPEDWYYEYVNVAALHGLVSGVGGGKFDPNANITRQDMAIMIVKAYEKLLGKAVKGVPVEIKDLPMVSAYAKDRVLAARFNQLIGGYPDGTFKPMNNATRAEAGQMVGNLMNK